MDEVSQEVKPSQVVQALADLASQGKYDNVTPAVSQQMNALFEVVAQLINVLEENEKQQEEQVEETADEK